MDDIWVRSANVQSDLRAAAHPEQESESFRQVPLKEFLSTDLTLLSNNEQKIQLVLEAIYSLNGGSPPIYDRFPKREKPLVIDLITPCDEGSGIYFENENIIRLNKIEDSSFTSLTEALSHELKHAQQYMPNRFSFNHYQQHQLGFLAESQAQACAARVLMSLGPQHPHAIQFVLSYLAVLGSHNKKPTVEENLKITEEQMTIHFLNQFLHGDTFKKMYRSYKDDFDCDFPIHRNDVPLDKIPDQFNLSESESILKLLASFPKNARTRKNQVLQALENRDMKEFSILLNARNKNGNFTLSDNTVHRLQFHVIAFCEQTNSTLPFQTLLESGRFQPKSINAVLGRIFSLPTDKIPFDSLLNTKSQLLESVCTLYPKNSDHSKLDRAVKTAVDFATDWGRATHNPQQEQLTTTLFNKYVELMYGGSMLSMFFLDPKTK